MRKDTFFNMDGQVVGTLTEQNSLLQNSFGADVFITTDATIANRAKDEEKDEIVVNGTTLYIGGGSPNFFGAGYAIFFRTKDLNRPFDVTEVYDYIENNGSIDVRSVEDSVDIATLANTWFVNNGRDCCILDLPLNSALPVMEDSSSSAARDTPPCNGMSATAWLMSNGYDGDVTLELFGLTTLATGEAMIQYILDTDGYGCNDDTTETYTYIDLAEYYYDVFMQKDCNKVYSLAVIKSFLTNQPLAIYGGLSWSAANPTLSINDMTASVFAHIQDVICKEEENNTQDIYGCTDPSYDNYEPLATIDNGGCANTEFLDQPDVEGCTDSTSANYNPYATIDDGSCIPEYNINTQPSGNADNSDLYASLLSLDGEYGDLIQDTIELIQNLQNAYEDALESGGTSSEQAAELQEQLTAANNQLNELLGSNGLLQAITSAVDSAVDGNYDSTILANVGEIIAPDGSSSSTSVSAIDSALQTINTYYSDTSDYAQISSDLVTAQATIEDLQAQLAIADDGITQSELDAIQGNFDAFQQSIQNALNALTSTPPTGGNPVSTSGNLTTQVQSVVTAYNSLVSTYNNLVSEQSGLEPISEVSLTQAELDDLLAEAAANALIGYEPISEVSLTQAELDELLANAASNALEGYELISEVSLTQAEYDAAIADAVASALVGMEQVSEVSLTQAELDALLADAASNALIGYEPISEVSLTQAELDELLANAASNALEGYELISEVSLTQAEYDAAINEAVSAALEGMIQDTGQAATILDLENELATAQDTIAELNAQLTGSVGNNEVSNATLQAAYDTIDQLIAQAETQFQIYANDIAAYEDFLSSLSDSMTTLENFLTNNYGYDPTAGASSLTIPTEAGFGSFDGSMPLPDIYLNFAGKAIGVPRGFKQFNGQPRMLNVTGTEATFELKDSTKKILWGAGIVILSLGAFKLIKSK